jgi:hypothetical protein
MPSIIKTKKKNVTISTPSNNRQRLKRLMRRMASSEFSASQNAATNRYEMSPEYRRIE